MAKKKAVPTEKATSYSIADNIGQSGVVHYGHRSRVEDEWHPHIRGRMWMRIIKEMEDNDSIIGGSINVIRNSIRQVQWHAQPADGSTESQKQADFLDGAFADMDTPWDGIVSDAVSMVPYGFAPFEKVHKRRMGKRTEKRVSSKFDDGLIGWRGWYIRSQDSLQEWEWDNEGFPIGMWQMVQSVQSQPVFIPMDKLLLFRLESNRGSPEGRSMLRNIYRSWYFLKRIQEQEAIAIERDATGLPVIRVPTSFFEAQKGLINNPEKTSQLQKFQKMVQQIRRNDHEGLVFPAKLDANGKDSGYDISLLATGGQRVINTDTAIKRLQKEMGINFNTQFQQLGVETNGSQSLSSDFTSMFTLGCGAVLRVMKEVSAQAVDELYELNGVPEEYRATWEHGDIEKQDMSKFADAAQKFISSGAIVPDDNLETYFREELGWPPRMDHVEGEQPRQTPAQNADAAAQLDQAAGRADEAGLSSLAKFYREKAAKLRGEK